MPEHRSIHHGVCAHCGEPFSYESGPYYARKYCSDACARKSRIQPLSVRFWKHINRDGPIPAHRPEIGPCWIWTASRGSTGYGQINLGHGKPAKAHRVSYELTYGPVPDGLFVCHHCDNPLCVRPSHLFAGTHQENMDDLSEKERQALGDRLPQSKLDPVSVTEIRARYAAGGVSQSALGREYGVTQGSIYDVITRKSWKHVP